jgi:type II secretory pathway component PulC
MIDLKRIWRGEAFSGVAFWVALMVLAFAATIDINWSVRGAQRNEVVGRSEPETISAAGGSARKDADISAALESPAFHADRKRFKPPPKVVAVVQAPPPAFRLAGIVEGADTRWAYLEMKDSGEARRVKAGDEIDGWTVEAIEQDLVRLRRGSEEAILGPESGASNDGARPRRGRESRRRKQ